MMNTIGKSAFDPAQQGLDISVFSKRVQDYLQCENALEELKFRNSSISLEKYEEMEAGHAHGHIILAKQEILKLRAKIEMWEQSIADSEREIRKYKRKQNAKSSNKPGRPVRNETNELAAREFTMKWVASLMDTLGAKGCGAKRGLEMLVPTMQERNWRRWLSGETIPTYSTIESLLNTRIAHGKYSGKMLCKVPVSPSHDQILALLRFI